VGTRTKPARAAPVTDSGGTPFVNGCAPGYVPFFLEMTGSMKVLCTGLCAAHVVDNSGTNPASATGDLTKTAKDVADPAPVAGHGVCTAQHKGSADPEDCVFLWGFLASANGKPDALATDQFRVGVCFDFGKFTYDQTQFG